MKIVVFGGSGPTGKLIVEKALEADMSVRVLARTPSKLTLTHPKLEVVQGDALNASNVAAAVAGMDAVVTTLGVPYTFKAVTLYSEATALMLDAMKSASVRRFVGVTSGGTHPGHDPNTPWFFEYLLKPLIGRTLYADMRRMEALVMGSSDIDWTILRPSRLVDRPASGRVRVECGQYTLPKGDEVSREDLAAVIVQTLTDDDFISKAAAVTD